MPRRTRRRLSPAGRRARALAFAAYREKPRPPMTTDQLAQSLVVRGLASPLILDWGGARRPTGRGGDS